MKGISPGTTTAVVTVGGVDAKMIITVTPLTAEFIATPTAAKRVPARWLAAAGAVIVIAFGAWAIARRGDERQPIASTISTGAVAAPSADSTAVPATTSPAVPATTVPADTVVAAFELTVSSPMAVEVGETQRLAARVSNRRGELLPTTRVDWEASNPAAATVDRTGVLTAVAPGRSEITAKVGRRTRVLAVDVILPLVARVVVSIARDSLRPGDFTTALVQLFDRREAALQEAVTWRSSSAAVASVDRDGVIRASGPGRTTISASAGGVADSAQIVVSTVGSAEAPTPKAEPRAAPTEAEVQAIVDSIVVMVGRRTVRMSQLLRTSGDAGTAFQSFVETNSPSARLAGAASVSSVSATNANVSAGLVLQWEQGEARRERTVNIECVVEAVARGWAIREIRFPNGFTP